MDVLHSMLVEEVLKVANSAALVSVSSASSLNLSMLVSDAGLVQVGLRLVLRPPWAQGLVFSSLHCPPPQQGCCLAGCGWAWLSLLLPSVCGPPRQLRHGIPEVALGMA